jgi:phosphate transport system substrate-binding protein
MNRDGHYIHPTSKHVTAAAAVAWRLGLPADLRFFAINQPGKDSYPICWATCAILPSLLPADRAGRLRDFLHWATHQGQEHCEALGYARLPAELVRGIEARLKEIRADK